MTYQNAPVDMGVPRRFLLYRHVDVTGISGTGLVASGVMWGDGSVALHWHTTIRSHVIFPSLQDLIALHWHGGATDIEWLDPLPEVA
jgi:hypothetical protein